MDLSTAHTAKDHSDTKKSTKSTTRPAPTKSWFFLRQNKTSLRRNWFELLLVVNNLDFIDFREVDFHSCGSTEEDGFEFNNFGISIDGEDTTFGAF